jgi:hypothetical protein
MKRRGERGRRKGEREGGREIIRLNPRLTESEILVVLRSMTLTHDKVQESNYRYKGDLWLRSSRLAQQQLIYQSLVPVYSLKGRAG